LPTSFGASLERTFEKHGQLCVGIDPHESLLEEWGLPDNAEGLRRFSFSTLEAAAGTAGIIKPQVAFFERFGSAGFKVLEDLALAAQQTDLLVIMDAKRGDIGSTMAGYFEAWLGKSAPFVCDALTVSPYLGVDSLAETMSEAIERGKGLFLLAATSNDEAKVLQRAQIGDMTVAADVYDRLEKINSVNLSPGARIGSLGAVVGATLNLSASGLARLQSESDLHTPILAPGFGAQGARLDEMADLFGVSSNRVIATVSRSVLATGASGLKSAILQAKQQLLKGVGRA
jgi:orotidine-5'-phosphate decarboxylase